jgi:hypothetical protein
LSALPLRRLRCHNLMPNLASMVDSEEKPFVSIFLVSVLVAPL